MSSEEEYDDFSPVEYSDDDEDYYDEVDDALEVSQAAEEIQTKYTYPTSHTKTGLDVHRMKYQCLSVEDVEEGLEARVSKLDSILQRGADDCRILLIKYDWHDDKLLEAYTNEEPAKFAEKNHISVTPHDAVPRDLVCHDHDFNCAICCDSGDIDTFHMAQCGHRFCCSCWSHYVGDKNQAGELLIKCPMPDCKQVMRLSEIQQLSDWYESKCADELAEEQKEELSKKHRPLTEADIQAMYQQDIEPESEFSSGLSSYDEESSDDEVLEQVLHPAVKVRSQVESPPPEETKKADENLFNFEQRMMLRERKERDKKRNQSLVAKYWYNVASQYCMRNGRSFQNCPFPDCDSLVEMTGFDSTDVVSLDEYVKRLLIPSVQCLHKHQFCYKCLTEDHTPCPCVLMKKWEKKCKDDTETAHWISAHTKSCPKCGTTIEKNGGCNHMTCRKCAYEFCWICMGEWEKHGGSFYNCTKYVESDDEGRTEAERNRNFLKKYLFYFNLFENQRTSLTADKRLLEKFESKIRQMMSDVRYIETMFYRESVDILLQARRVLMWSYAVMYYVPNNNRKLLLETLQLTLSNAVELLSRLFLDTQVHRVLEKREQFLNAANAVKRVRESLTEAFVDALAGKEVVLLTGL